MIVLKQFKINGYLLCLLIFCIILFSSKNTSKVASIVSCKCTNRIFMSKVYSI